MKKPDEIKKALECCFNAAQCGDCPYYPVSCDRELVRDAREYIRQLEAERDALKEYGHGSCVTCKHVDKAVTDDPCSECVCKNKTLWEWRGVKKEG